MTQLESSPMDIRATKVIVHSVTGAVALLTIAIFWTSTVVSELSGSVDAIVRVKTLIPWGFLLLVPALAITGATGFSLAGHRVKEGLSRRKMRRMRVVAANGALVLVPAALFLAWKAGHQALDTGFYLVQGIELIAGAINVALIALNARDGFTMSGRFRSRRATRR